MSIALVNAAFDAPLSQTQKLVLLSLCRRADDNGECYPSYTTICRDTNICRRTVHTAIASLERMNIIRRDHRNGFRCYYYINNRSEWQLDLAHNRCKRRTGATDIPVQQMHITGATDAHDRCKSRQVTGATDAHTITVLRTVIEPSVNRKDNTAPNYSPIDDLSNRGVDAQTIADWLLHRKKMKASVSATVVNVIANEADKAGIALQEALQLCCMRGWRGFKADWVVSPTASMRAPPRGESVKDRERREFIEQVTNPTRRQRNVFDV